MEFCTDAILSKSQEYNSTYTSNTIEILGEPIDTEGKIDSYVNFSAEVRADGHGPKYQWYDKYAAPIPRMCQRNLTIGPITEEDFGFYRLEIKDESANEIKLSRWVELKKSQPKTVPAEHIRHSLSPHLPRRQIPEIEQLEPKLVIAPETGSHPEGSRIILTAHFENAASYQWYKDQTMLEGCTTNMLIISNANLGNSGDYVITAFNYSGNSNGIARITIY